MCLIYVYNLSPYLTQKTVSVRYADKQVKFTQTLPPTEDGVSSDKKNRKLTAF